jgi:adenylosuccinate synthase
VLFEGAQGTMLDVDFGTYPFVTSSNPIAGAACVGSGVGPAAIDEVLGVVKAYTTRVGDGPFPTELKDSFGDALRERGQEFGATTGRPRRCGWFDAVVVRHAVRINGLTRLSLTKLDVLEGVDPIRVCVAYRVDGKVVKDFPASRRAQVEAVPIYKELPGFSGPVKGSPATRIFPTRPKNIAGSLKRGGRAHGAHFHGSEPRRNHSSGQIVPVDSMKARLALETGRVFEGNGFGAVGETAGEVVFAPRWRDTKKS